MNFTANWYCIAPEVDENVLELNSGDDCTILYYTENHRIV